MRLRHLAFSAASLAALAAPAAAQTFGTLDQDSRAAVLDVVAAGRGGTVAAVATPDSPFFSNPAHMAGTQRLRRRFDTRFGTGFGRRRHRRCASST